MTWVAVAIGGSAVVGAGASIYASNKAASASKGGPNPRVADPFSDPLMLGVSSEALQGLGSNIGQAGLDERGSPMNQFLNELEGSGLGNKVKRNASYAIRWYMEHGLDPTDTSLGTLNDRHEPWKPGDIPLVPRNVYKMSAFVKIATDSLGFRGFQNWSGLSQAEQTYQTRTKALQAQMAPLLDSIKMNRAKGQASLADIAGNAGQRTDELSALYEPQIARQFQDQRNQILQSANQGRFNPGAALGRLGETQALTQKTSAIERALQILGGQSSIVQGALAPAQNLALATSQQRQGGQLNLANIGAAQSQAQQQLAQRQAENSGTGIASAGAQIGNIGLLLSLLGQGGKSSGPAAPPASNSVMANQPGFNPLGFLGQTQ